MRRFALAVVLSIAFGCGGGTDGVGARETLPPANPNAVREFQQGVRLLERRDRASAERAKEHFQAALSMDETLWEARYNLGLIARRRGRLEEAVEHFAAARAINAAASEPILGLAEARHAQGDLGESIDLLEDFVERVPDAIDVRVALASVLLEATRYRPALAQAREVLTRDPTRVDALLVVGRVYRARQQYDVARLVFQKALALVPADDARARATIHDDIGRVELAFGDTQAAFAAFAQSVAADPRYAPAHMDQGAVLLRAGDYAGAKAEYEAALAIDASNLEARVALGITFRGLGEHRNARREYDQVLRDEPDHPDAILNLGILLAEFLDNRTRARRLFERFLQVAPSSHPGRELAERYLREIPAPGAPQARLGDASATEPS